MSRTETSPAWILLAIALVGTAISLGTTHAAHAQNVRSQGDPQTLLFVQTTPAGATVRLEGKELGKSNKICVVKPGTYKIIIDLSGHEPREEQVTVREGRITRIEWTFDADAATKASRRRTPQVVATNPSAGATDVDPDLEYITVVFDQDMAEGFSFPGSGPSFPTVPAGKGPTWKDKRTCVLPVELKKAHYYRMGVNSKSFQNFRSAAGMPAVPATIFFTTQGADDELKKRVCVPRAISITPGNRASDVDPKVTEIRVTFDMPMATTFSWVGGGPRFPDVPEGGMPSWSEDGKTCVLPVQLRPSWDYVLGLNSATHTGFQSQWAVPMKPVVYQFGTKAAGAGASHASDEPKNLPRTPQIVSITPENGAKDVSPSVRQIRVVFDRPMASSFSWTGGGPEFPQIPEGKRPTWSKDRKTCMLPVQLKPNSNYTLGLNSVSFKNFKSDRGVPLEPVVYKIRTKSK